MKKTIFLTGIFIILSGVFSLIQAQSADIGIKANLAGGDVKLVGAEKIILQTVDGAIDVVLSKVTQYKRISPENPSLKAAIDSSLAEVGVGDKIVVTGEVTSDKKSVIANKIFIMSKADLSAKQAKEAGEWRTRGIVGKVETVNPQTKEITVSVRNVMGEKKVVLKPKAEAEFMRYAPDSERFSEAVTSSFADIKAGDSIRAVGDKNADETTFAAEKVLTGAFQTVAGTITAVNPEKNEITISDIKTKKEITIVVGSSSIVKEFPAEIAQRLARFQMMQASGMQPPQGAGGGNRPAGAGNNPPQRPGGNRPQGAGGENNSDGNGTTGGGRGMRGGGSIDEMIDNFPAIKVSDLQVGKMIAASSTKTKDESRITAIKLLAGVEPFLTMPQMPRGGGRGGQSGQSSSFSIPGLDGGGGGFDGP